ncbi:hypothetical protein Glove_303g112 [Diversispora epigaea]|uniref:Uncharacterized protein n=1 Tax=Diversispora epigaea TaxID=1348612 RepID=A0A397HZK2_9GLOM|nr:hypothetical protein Glove_303g112 [Diversispora epigaea]
MEHYNLRNPDESISLKKYNFLPTLPFRLVVAESSESEKTRMVVRMLLGSKYLKVYPIMLGEKDKVPKNGNYGERYIPCDDLLIVALHEDEYLWKTVQYFYEFIAKDKQAPWYKDVRFKIIIPDKLPNITSFKNTGWKRLLVFDNLAEELLSTQLKIIPFFKSGRHNNINSIFISQHYFEIHQNIRENATHISIHCGFGILNSIKCVLKNMYDDYESLAKKVYEVIKKQYVVIDIQRSADDSLSI